MFARTYSTYGVPARRATTSPSSPYARFEYLNRVPGSTATSVRPAAATISAIDGNPSALHDGSGGSVGRPEKCTSIRRSVTPSGEPAYGTSAPNSGMCRASGSSRSSSPRSRNWNSAVAVTDFVIEATRQAVRERRPDVAPGDDAPGVAASTTSPRSSPIASIRAGRSYRSRPAAVSRSSPAADVGEALRVDHRLRILGHRAGACEAGSQGARERR